ncbi:MAG TPA: HtaA domain-containing protein, partial [Terrimesophilobacter sp.]|nr:HtaA domain-containing protein [Terrimesophilobacter sp.]
GSGSTYALFSTFTPITFNVVTEPEPPVTPTPVPGGSLRWGISTSFVNYITGGAGGSIIVTGGATQSGGLFQFGQSSSTFDASTGTGTVNYLGVVRFTGHGGALDVTISNPQITVHSASSATLTVASGGSRVALATLNLAAAAKSISNGAVTYAGTPATLTAAGLSQVFQGTEPSSGLAPVTFTIGSAAAAPAGLTGTVASAPEGDDEIPDTPPASTGIDLDDETRAAINAGEQVTFTADGFQPNESGIQVVVYSKPILLGTTQADASGTATWTGLLPETLADGEHTITFQGSVDRGAVFTLQRTVVTAIGTCTVQGATLNWGFKESFRVYVEGIAQGGWNLSDVEYEFPEFVWSDATGAIDPDTLTGTVAFPGELNFH